MLVLSGIPGNNIQDISLLSFPHADKAAHFFMYYIFCFLLIYGFRGYGLKNLNLSYILAAVIAIAYGAVMELLQHYIFINRSGNIYDVLANSAGAVTAVITYKTVMKLFIRIKTTMGL